MSSYNALHKWLRENYPKTGRCERCSQAADTHFALIHGRSYTRNREDYQELCPGCHSVYDRGGERNTQAKLTVSQVSEIRARYAPAPPSHGLHPNSARSLAREFGVSDRTVRDIVNNRRWKP